MSDHDFHDEEALDVSYDRAILTWLLRYARPQWRALAACVVMLLCLSALQLAQPSIIRLAIDRAIAPAGTSAGSGAGKLLAQLQPLVLLYLGSVIAIVGVQYLQSYWLRRTGQRIITAIRRDAFAHLETLSLAYFDSRPVGRIVTRVTNDIEALSEMYTSILVNLFRDVFFIVGALVLLLRLDARLSLVALGAVPLVVITAIAFRRVSRTAYREMRLRLARINAMLAETFSGVRVVQVFNRQTKGSDEFRTVNDAFYGAAMHVIRVFATFGPILDMLTTVTLATVIWVGGGKVIGGALSLGTLYAFNAYTRLLFDPINALAEKYNILQAALAAAERLTELVNTRPQVEDPPPGVARMLPAASAEPAVVFDDVWFAYQENDWVLRGVSFSVMPGETVAFVGHTGAGKSTIMNLVPRFYDVSRGAVRVHGVDVRQVEQRALRRRVGIVMQDVFLFSGTVAGNVDLGDETIDRAAIEHAARVVGADAFIGRLPGGYDETVVERGLSLSAGQRQLISFARAVAYDPEILILDEATASIDSETEEALQAAMRALARGRTSIIVAHRLATVRDADRIYVMHHGRIVEIGRHEDLLEHDGLYRKLWDLQFGVPGETDGRVA
jgi:ATP-binding cassette, subfamily B, multidrug efflux pump